MFSADRMKRDGCFEAPARIHLGEGQGSESRSVAEVEVSALHEHGLVARRACASHLLSCRGHRRSPRHFLCAIASENVTLPIKTIAVTSNTRRTLHCNHLVVRNRPAGMSGRVPLPPRMDIRYRRVKVQYNGTRPARSAFASYRVGGQPIGRVATDDGASKNSCPDMTKPTHS
jgi:hypothetical protein